MATFGWYYFNIKKSSRKLKSARALFRSPSGGIGLNRVVFSIATYLPAWRPKSFCVEIQICEGGYSASTNKIHRLDECKYITICGRF